MTRSQRVREMLLSLTVAVTGCGIAGTPAATPSEEIAARAPGQEPLGVRGGAIIAAGGAVSEFDGSDLNSEFSTCLASNRALHEDLQNLLV